MRKYVFKNEENRITGIQDCALFHDESLESLAFDFPEDFAFGTEEDYRLIDGELAYDPLPKAGDTQPTLEERTTALEAAVLDIIMGGGSI